MYTYYSNVTMIGFQKDWEWILEQEFESICFLGGKLMEPVVLKGTTYTEYTEVRIFSESFDTINDTIDYLRGFGHVVGIEMDFVYSEAAQEHLDETGDDSLFEDTYSLFGRCTSTKVSIDAMIRNGQRILKPDTERPE
ncbi:MAG: hypothetical protein RSC68_17330 [Acinetobacter sp.]